MTVAEELELRSASALSVTAKAAERQAEAAEREAEAAARTAEAAERQAAALEAQAIAARAAADAQARAAAAAETTATNVTAQVGPEGPTGADSTVPGPVGPVGPKGADSKVPGPVGPVGPKGADSTVPGPVGAAGTNGTNGTAGVDGRTVLNGEGPPPLDIGLTGDFYIETKAGAAVAIYGPRRARSWGSATKLQGPRGPAGASGGGAGGSSVTVYDDGVQIAKGFRISFDGGDAITVTDGVIHVPVGSAGPGSDDQTAAEVPFTPAGSISATNVQDAIEEVAAEAGGSLTILDEGTPVGVATSLDFQGTGVSVGVPSGGVVPVVVSGGGSILREQVDSGLFSVPGNGANTFLPWTKANGSDLIDLTDPTLPTVIEAGVYAFNGFTTKSGNVYDITQTGWFGLDIDANGEDAFADVTFNLASIAAPAASAHVTAYCAAGAVLQAAVRQDTGFTYNFRFQCAIQRIS